MNKYLLFFVAVGILSCKNKKEDEGDKSFFPVLSFITSQVADVDTSVYPILKIVTVDSLSDTAYIKREEFRQYANDFLTMPDISEKKWNDGYNETKLYDEDLKRVILNYMPKDVNKEIRRQEVMIEPGQQSDDKVRTIIIDRVLTNEDSIVQKNMLWQVDKHFQVVTVTNKNNQPEKIQKL
ncbi:MAG TPA: hypothetical protein VNA26_08955, partial [Chitinophagaceae bacterium]|nr:hypothetical protein [Chitinophagaceae bacterium]